MKKCVFHTPSFRNDERVEMYFDTTDEAVNIILNEVFFEQCYKDGLDYIKAIDKPLVLDVGGHIGDTALYFGQKEGARVIVMEPVKANFDCLVHNVASNSNIVPINYGLMSHVCKMDIALGGNPGDGGQSLYGKGEKESVNLINLSYVIDHFKLTHIDLMKIDVEGAEYAIFMTKSFLSHADKIGMIIGEAHLNPVMPFALEKILTDAGFKFSWLPYKNCKYNWEITCGEETVKNECDYPTLFKAVRN